MKNQVARDSQIENGNNGIGGNKGYRGEKGLGERQ
jgi:hypothetical protein